MNPSILLDQTLATISLIGMDINSFPFASITKNVDNSFKITFFLSDPMIIG